MHCFTWYTYNGWTIAHGWPPFSAEVSRLCSAAQCPSVGDVVCMYDRPRSVGQLGVTCVSVLVVYSQSSSGPCARLPGWLRSCDVTVTVQCSCMTEQGSDQPLYQLYHDHLASDCASLLTRLSAVRRARLLL